MMSTSQKMPFIAAFIFLACMMLSAITGYRYGSSESKRQMAEANRAAAEKIVEMTEKALERELSLRADLDNLASQTVKEKEDAKKTITDLRNDVRNGHVRLSVVTNTCRGVADSEHATFGYREARAELDPAFAESLITITSDGDNAIRELNYCIDQYETVRHYINPDLQ